MTRNKQLRDILEPDAPRLSPEAGERLDRAVAAAMTQRRRPERRLLRLGLIAAPAAALALFAILWFRPVAESPDYVLLNEEQFLTALTEWGDPADVAEALYSTDFSDYENTETWNESDWDAFRQDLEGFQLADNNGGES